MRPTPVRLSKKLGVNRPWFPSDKSWATVDLETSRWSSVMRGRRNTPDIHELRNRSANAHALPCDPLAESGRNNFGS